MNSFLHAVKKNAIAVLMMVLGLGMSQHSFGQVPILYYDFENNTTRTTFENLVEQSINSGSGALTSAGIGSVGGVAGAGTFNSGSANGQAITGNTWSSSTTDPGTAAANYQQFVVNTSGFSGITISFDNQASGTGPARVGVLWSTNGSTFTAATTAPVLTGNNTFAVSGSFVLPAGADNGSSITIRVYAYAGSTSDRASRSSFANTGTFRIDNLTVFASSTVTNSGSKILLNESNIYTSVTSGLTGSSYVRTNLTVASGSTVTASSFTTFGGTLTINSTGKVATGANTVSIQAGGTASVSGTFQIDQGGWGGNTGTWTYSSGTLIFNNTSGPYSIGSTDTWWPSSNGPANVTVQNGGGITMNSISRTVSGTFLLVSGTNGVQGTALTLNGTVQINGGNFQTTPTYGASSTLIYNTSYGVSNEWTGNSTTAGSGVPNNVTIQNSAAVTMPNGANQNRGLAGSLSINSGSLTLGNNSNNNDIYIAGSWTRASGATFNPNGRAVIFNGSGTQTLSAASGTETFNYFIVNKSANNVQFSSTDVVVNATTGNPLQILSSGGIDVNGKKLSLTNDNGGIDLNSGSRTITSTASGGIFSVEGNKTASTAAILNLSTNVTLNIASSKTLDMSTSSLTMITTSLTGTGSLTTASTSSTPIPSGRTWPYDITFNSASNQTIPANTYGNLIFSGGAGIKQVLQDIAISGNWTINSGVDVRNNGGVAGRTITMSGASPTLSVAGTITGTGIGTNNDLNLTYSNTTGTLSVSGTGSLCRFLNATFSNTGATLALARSFDVSFGTFTMNGTLRVDAGGSVATTAPTYGSSSNLIYNSGTSYTSALEWPSTSPTNVVIQNSTALALAADRSVSGDFTISSGSLKSNSGLKTLTMTGGTSGSPKTFTESGAMFGEFSGNTLGLAFNGFTSLAGTTGYLDAKTYTVNGTLICGTVGLNSNSASPAAGQVIISATGILKTSNSFGLYDGSSLNPTIRFNGTAMAAPSISATSTIDYNASAGGQTISSLTYGNLTLSNTSGTQTAAGNLTVNGTLVTNSGGTLDMGSTALLAGTLTTITNDGTISTSVPTSTSTTPIPSGKTWSGTGAVQFAGTSSQTAVAGTFNNLILNNSSGAVLSGNIITTGLVLTSGSLSIGSNILSLNGAVTNTSGTLNGTSSSTLSLGGSSAQSLAFATGASLASLNVAKTGGTSTLVSVGDTLRIFTGIDFTGNSSGVLALNDQEIKIKSSASGTAYIGQSSSSTLTGATKITVERFIPNNGNRSWRLLAVPTTGSQTINSAWQNGQASGVAGAAGLGTWITSNVAGATGLGYDAQTPGNSLLTYNQTSNLWVGVTSNTSSQLAPTGTDGYMLYVRGDRTSTNGNSTVTATTLSSRGGIRQNNQSAISIPVNTTAAYVMIGNPFASAIDLRNLTLTSFADQNTLNFFVYDPQMGTLGGFVTLQKSGGNYVAQTVGGVTFPQGSNVNTIESGQAFFIQSQSVAGTIAVPEGAKVTTSSLVFRQSASPASSLKRYLFTALYAGQDSSARIMDGTTQYFDPGFSNLVDDADARKIGNFTENLGISNGVATLSVEKRGAIASADTIFFSISNMKIQGYQFRFIAAKLTQPGVRAFLEDSYLHSSTPVALNDTTTVNFTVDANAGSYASNRFRLVFKTRPVAVTDNNTGTDELSIVSNGTTKSIGAYPNPVTGGMVNISFKNEPAGDYHIVLYNMKGQALFTKTLAHAGGNAAHPLLIGKSIANGSYKLVVIHPDNTRTEQTVIVAK